MNSTYINITTFKNYMNSEHDNNDMFLVIAVE